jgi:NAD(P)-dependent dehydrogenase (short-subunit alcohol dehydrogenase family)
MIYIRTTGQRPADAMIGTTKPPKRSVAVVVGRPAGPADGPSTIVTVCSVNASLPDPGIIDYRAAMAALRSFCKSLSKEPGPRGQG